MGTITGNQNFPTAAQVPNNAIMDKYYKQNYLGNQFVLMTAGVSLGSTSETMIQLIQNKSTTKSLFVSLRRISSSAQSVLFKYYSNPTFSAAGTPVTPLNLRPASSTVSISTCTTTPTVSANGTLIDVLGCASGYANSTDMETMIILDPGQSMLITATALVSTTLVNSEIQFYEL